ncbi:sce7725 family protein [Flavobacterium rakeshii]|uniref:sce7725 family protein n=1 Tax=Flavobacterium rakeshii TaxID=1038845 RepID=UPI002E7B9AF9|nr:sce7725 family protein [Flavobacterium rakeshii]MEE1899567.1 sce7725 family protein [Flavobacterium rakeshii]
MYYPYLRGRQFELKAIQEYAELNRSQNNILPIIEPVRKTFSNLKTAINKLSSNDVTFALVLNPNVGEIKSPSTIIDGLAEILPSVKWHPAFLVDSNYNFIAEVINNLGYENIILICSDESDVSNNEFQELLSSNKIDTVVSKDNRTLKRYLDSINKGFIRFDDNFNIQKRNSDFLEMSEEKFTEEHLYYKQDGYVGFCDFTSIPSVFNESGGVPYSVAIHLTYQKSSSDIWIRHFASSINSDSFANIQGKFAEAAQKAVLFLDNQNIHTEASEELRKYVRETKYPGLGMVKKISIKHHLELVNNII